MNRLRFFVFGLFLHANICCLLHAGDVKGKKGKFEKDYDPSKIAVVGIVDISEEEREVQAIMGLGISADEKKVRIQDVRQKYLRQRFINKLHQMNGNPWNRLEKHFFTMFAAEYHKHSPMEPDVLQTELTRQVREAANFCVILIAEAHRATENLTPSTLKKVQTNLRKVKQFLDKKNLTDPQAQHSLYTEIAGDYEQRISALDDFVIAAEKTRAMQVKQAKDLFKTWLEEYRGPDQEVVAFSLLEKKTLRKELHKKFNLENLFPVAVNHGGGLPGQTLASLRELFDRAISRQLQSRQNRQRRVEASKTAVKDLGPKLLKGTASTAEAVKKAAPSRSKVGEFAKQAGVLAVGAVAAVPVCAAGVAVGVGMVVVKGAASTADAVKKAAPTRSKVGESVKQAGVLAVGAVAAVPVCAAGVAVGVGKVAVSAARKPAVLWNARQIKYRDEFELYKKDVAKHKCDMSFLYEDDYLDKLTPLFEREMSHPHLTPAHQLKRTPLTRAVDEYKRQQWRSYLLRHLGEAVERDQIPSFFGESYRSSYQGVFKQKVRLTAETKPQFINLRPWEQLVPDYVKEIVSESRREILDNREANFKRLDKLINRKVRGLEIQFSSALDVKGEILKSFYPAPYAWTMPWLRQPQTQAEKENLRLQSFAQFQDLYLENKKREEGTTTTQAIEEGEVLEEIEVELDPTALAGEFRRLYTEFPQHFCLTESDDHTCYCGERVEISCVTLAELFGEDLAKFPIEQNSTVCVPAAHSDGHRLSSCGHFMHQSCLREYQVKCRDRIIDKASPEGNQDSDLFAILTSGKGPEYAGQYTCPKCRAPIPYHEADKAAWARNMGFKLPSMEESNPGWQD